MSDWDDTIALLNDGIALIQSRLQAAQSGEIVVPDLFALDLELGALRARLPRGVADPGFDVCCAVLRPYEHLADGPLQAVDSGWIPALERMAAARDALRTARERKRSRKPS